MGASICVTSLGVGARLKGMLMHKNFPPSHMNCMYCVQYAVSMANKEVHPEVADI